MKLFLTKRKRSWFYIFIWLMIFVAILYINFFSDLYAKINTLIVVVACIRLLRWWWSAGIHRLTTAQQSVGGCRSQKTPGFCCLLSWNKALILHKKKKLKLNTYEKKVFYFLIHSVSITVVIQIGPNSFKSYAFKRRIKLKNKNSFKRSGFSYLNVK